MEAPLNLPVVKQRQLNIEAVPLVVYNATNTSLREVLRWREQDNSDATKALNINLGAWNSLPGQN